MLDGKPTGVGVFTYNLVNALHRKLEQERRMELTVFTPTAQHLDAGVRMRYIPRFVQYSDFPVTSAISRLAWNQIAYPRVARKMDILLNPSSHGHLWGQNQILTIHDLLSLRFQNISTHQRIYFQRILPHLVRKSSAIIAVSESTKKDIMQFFNVPAEHIHVVYNGFDNRSFSPARGTSAAIREWSGVSEYILAVGPTYPHKNFDTLIKAYALLPASARIQHPLLVTGGRPAYLSALKSLAAAAGVAANIHFTGYVPQHLMPALYQEAKMLVFPSLYEGFGIPLLEAMACGCPVVSSNASSMPEVCGKAALYANPESPEALSQAIVTMLSSDTLRKRMSELGIVRAAEFSWDRTATQVLQIIKSFT